ncbi:MAG: D-alanyl-D-alanine carboxypeptidase family protein [Candidatus Pristimantibacillus sp.]
MKKWVFIMFIIALLWISNKGLLPSSEHDGKAREQEQTTMKDTLKGEDTVINIAADQVYQGDLLLVNKKYPIRENSMRSDIVYLFGQEDLVQGYGLLNAEIQLSESIALQFNKMVRAAGVDGAQHFLISSGYRDFAEQNLLYEEKGSDYALPAGYSEHNLGLSLDIGSTEGEMSKAPEGKWLQKKAWKYGFILRYPKDKTAITGIQYEPWHFRYVGMPHSAIMQEHNFTLEEYLDFLKESLSILTVVEGKEYTVSYYPISKDKKIEIPSDHQYEISGNNIDGVIVTTYK